MAEYKIGDIETLTGIKAHTLRIWEKRYDLLRPDRSGNSTRTYGDEDLKKLLNIAVLQERGWKISKIAVLTDSQLSKAVIDISADDAPANLVLNLMLQSLSEFDDFKFSRLLDQVVSKEGMHACFMNYLIPFMQRVGILWSAGAISPAQEHFVSNLVREKLIAEIKNLPKSEKKTIDFLLYCPEDELHEIGLLYYEYMLKKKGYRTFYLGVNVPEEALTETIAYLKPQALVTSLISAFEKKDIKGHLDRIFNSFSLPVYLGGSFADQIELEENKKRFRVQSLLSA
ncbi:MAG: MerR family transcriptional regulator [Brumimicrobium sp.]|nr:MerR family transcriptional regulator [Brumimicrobium sp.]